LCARSGHRSWPHEFKLFLDGPLGWGDALTFLYNDPYRSIVGGKPPQALGQPTAVVWREIWADVAPRIQSALGGDEGTYDEALLLIMERHGYSEETYYTFSYSPIPDDDGRVAGIFCANTDDTRRVIGERQLALLRDLAAGTAEARTIRDACALSMRCLETNPHDAPFAVLYLLDPDQRRAALAGTARIAPGHPAAPAVIALDGISVWPIAEVVDAKEPRLISDLGASFTALPAGAWDQPPAQAVALPLALSGQTGLAGVLIVGLNPYRLFDDDYQRFLGLAAGQIGTAIADARAYEEERTQASTALGAAHYVEEALRWLPAAADTPEPQVIADVSTSDAARLAARNGAAPRARVLLADDNADLRDYLTRLLVAQYEVRTVANGAQALAAARAEPPDLVLSDVMMPELGGLGLLRELRADPRTSAIPVVLLSARSGEEFTVEGLQAGADDYLVKPFSARELLARVRTHIELARLRVRVEETLRQRTRQAELAAEIGAALTSDAPWLGQLQRCAEALVRSLDAAFARIWTLDEATEMLMLRASAGLYTHLDGPHSRVPLGALKIGRIAAERRPHLTNSVVGDPLVGDQDWARREGMVAFAGYPLVVGGRLIGVMALFARHELADATLDTLGAVADEIALGIVRAWADEERARLLIQERAARGETEAARQRLHDLFMQAPAIIAVTRGPDHVIDLVNPPYLQLVGRADPATLLGKPGREAMPELIEQGFFDLMDEVYRGGVPFIGTEAPVQLDRLDVGRRDEAVLNFVYQPSHDAIGAVDGILLHAVDVTEQVRARQRVEELARRLRAECDRLQQVVDLLPAAVVVTDAALTIQVSNRAVRALLGADAAPQRPPVAAGEAVPADDAAAFAAYGARHLDGTPYRAAEIPLARAALRGEETRGEPMLLRNAATGRDVPILANAAPLRDEAGTTLGGAVVFQDITGLRDLERAREEFLSSVAHDLKTPLTSIRGQTQLAQRRLAHLDRRGPEQARAVQQPHQRRGRADLSPDHAQDQGHHDRQAHDAVTQAQVVVMGHLSQREWVDQGGQAGLDCGVGGGRGHALAAVACNRPRMAHRAALLPHAARRVDGMSLTRHTSIVRQCDHPFPLTDRPLTLSCR